jgi:type IV pilus assembly protein PilB
MATTAKSVLGYLLDRKIIDLDIANKVRVEQSKTGKTEEEMLLELGVVEEVEIVKAKSKIFNIPYIDLESIKISDDVVSSLNIQNLKNLKVMPFEITDTEVKLAMLNPFDVQALQSLRVQIKKDIRFVVHITTGKSLEAAYAKLMGQTISTEVSKALEDVDTEITDLDSEETDSLSNQNLVSAPVARIVNSIFKFAIQVGASDIHIEPLEERLRVRFRVDGVLSEKLSLPKHTANAIIARIKIVSRLKIDEKRIPQDGRIQIKSQGKKIDVRVSTMPTIYDEKVVMRLLDVSAGIPALETSGLRGKSFENFLNAITATNGIILITGPTGSGKTRTLAGAIARVNRPEVNIITLEHPVEIRIPGVSQVNVRPDIGLTFANGLRSILRQDPDIVMVGEIRDTETAKLGVEASLTGHLVLATLHTNSAAASVGRLIEMGVEPYLLASTLKCVVAQRLPRKICKYCVEPYVPPIEVVENITDTMESVPNFDVFEYINSICNESNLSSEEDFKIKCPITDEKGNKKFYLYKGKGCQRCGYTGYSGRIAVFEVMPVSGEMGPMMLKGSLASEFETAATKNGMLKMIQDGYLRALEGVTTIEEILRVTKD